MTYKLGESILEKMKGPVICRRDGIETVYRQSGDLLRDSFDKRYTVDEITVRNGVIVITLSEAAALPEVPSSDYGKDMSFF